MKPLNKLSAIAATVLLALGTHSAANADDKLSVSGFLHLETKYTDVDGGDSEVKAGVEQAEVNLSYSLDSKFSVFADIEYDNGDPFTAKEIDLEQAYVTYAATDAVTLKAGRFLSYTGWEAEEITGRMQASKSGYADLFYGYYQQGVSALYNGGSFTVAASVVTDNGRAGGDQASPTNTDAKDPAIETMLAFSPTEEITVKAFYTVDGDASFFNTWAMYASGALTLAAEYNAAEYDASKGHVGPLGEDEATGYLLMGNYKFDDTYALTIRYTSTEVENEAGDIVRDADVITIAPSMTFSSGAKAILEYRSDESDMAADTSSLALHAVFTF